jgi:DNA-binding HxlR family transcriptional regulator
MIFMVISPSSYWRCLALFGLTSDYHGPKIVLRTDFKVGYLLESKDRRTPMNANEELTEERKCPIETVIHVLGGKWKPTILWLLLDSAKRFSELEKRIPGITQKMLAQHLRELENDRLITRTIYPSIPPKVVYALSEYGETLIPVLQTMCDWGENHKRPVAKQQVQAAANQ